MELTISDMIALFGAAFSVITAIIAMIILNRTNRRYKDYERTVNNLITPQRAHVENIIYTNTLPLVKDPGFFSDANHLLFDNSSDKKMLIRTKLPDFTFFEEMNINLSEVNVDDKLVACLMPFNKKFDRVKNTIQDTCKQLGYIFKRSDDELLADNNDIRKSIVKLILKAKVVIAVLDGRNPNVFYEIGIAHSMGKLVLMVANLNREEYQAYGRKQPIDLLSNRLITYNSQEELKENLTKTLKEIHYE